MADIKYLMDSFESYLAEKKKRENYYEEEKKKEGDDMSELGYKIMSTIVSWLTFVLAAYLSWECNGRSNPSMMNAERVTRALIAGWFGLFYIILYFMFWSGKCKKNEKSGISSSRDTQISKEL